MKSALHGLKQDLKRIKVPILSDLIRWYFSWRFHRTELGKYQRWIARGMPPPPPPLYKQMVVRSAAIDHGIRVLVETGTFEGQMVEAAQRDFARIYTIELDPALAARAAERFWNRPHITVMLGNSSLLLPSLLSNIGESVVFWLDAHYSGGPTAMGTTETPIMHELSAIAAHGLHRKHVLLIDDAREFSGGAYPTLEELDRWAHASDFDTLEVEGDIIRIYNQRRMK